MTTPSPGQRRVTRALDRLGRERFVAFLRAVRGEGGCLAVELANAALDAGAEVDAAVAWDAAIRSGYYLSVRKLATRRFEIEFGDVAGGLAGDGGTWTVTFGGDVVRGRLVSASDAVLELETRSGRRRFELSNVMRVERTSDSTINGVLRGTAVAAIWCVLACQNDANGRTDAGAYAGRLALGGLIGGAIDRRFSRPTILYRRGPANGISIGVGRQGVAVLF